MWRRISFSERCSFSANRLIFLVITLLGWVLWVGAQTRWMWYIWMCCCWAEVLSHFFCFVFKTLQERLKAFCHGLRGALDWLLQPDSWLSYIKKWVIMFSNGSSQWLFHSTSHLTVRCPCIITGDVLAHYWLREWSTRSLHLICLGKPANALTQKIKSPWKYYFAHWKTHWSYCVWSAELTQGWNKARKTSPWWLCVCLSPLLPSQTERSTTAIPGATSEGKPSQLRPPNHKKRQRLLKFRE